MNKKIIILTIPFLYLIFIAGCSSSGEVGEESNSDTSNVYIFDQVPSDTTIDYSEPKGFPPFNKKYFIVQIGAFLSQKNAEDFAQKSQVTIQHKVNISFNPQTRLYVVQLVPFYQTRGEAEKMRDTLWQMKDYKDAWILTVNK
jgi:SPOR domain